MELGLSRWQRRLGPSGWQTSSVGADPSRLVIRGHALIDERLDELLAYAYVGETPPFLHGPSFQRNVDLCGALGLMSSPFASLVNRLTKPDGWANGPRMEERR
jgi:hypothetical protein